MIVNFAHLLTVLDKIEYHDADVELEINNERYKITNIYIDINSNIGIDDESRHKIIFKGGSK